MSKIPVIIFKRVATAFDEVAKARYESSGSEHSPPVESSVFLSDLVNSFLESEEEEEVVTGGEGEGDAADGDCSADHQQGKGNCSKEKCSKNVLQSLFAKKIDECDLEMININTAVDDALHELGEDCSSSSPDYKRRLMALLRHQGFDAGLCKSKWEKSMNCLLPGYHEYIDVVMSEGTRYIIETSLSKEFEIARPTSYYSELLDHFPWIFVGKQDDLKQIVRIMCKSMKKSIKSIGMKVPPWRQLAYVNAKWFSSYKRTTNEVISIVNDHNHKASCFDEGLKRDDRFVGFVMGPEQVSSYHCRERLDSAATKGGGLRVGNLAAALQDDSFTTLKV